MVTVDVSVVPGGDNYVCPAGAIRCLVVMFSVRLVPIMCVQVATFGYVCHHLVTCGHPIALFIIERTYT